MSIREFTLIWLMLLSIAAVAQTDGGVGAATTDSTHLVLIKRVLPVYPSEAAEKHISVGIVDVKITVDDKGDVQQVDVIRGDPMFVPAAVDSVKQWKFEPFIKNGKPIQISTITRVYVQAPGVIGGIISSRPVNSDRMDPQRVRVSSAVIEKLAISRIEPVYPPLARQARIQGAVVIAALIGKDGDVQKVQVISGHPMLTSSAMDAVKACRFKPYLLNGQPVEIETQITVNFRLDEAKVEPKASQQ